MMFWERTADPPRTVVPSSLDSQMSSDSHCQHGHVSYYAATCPPCEFSPHDSNTASYCAPTLTVES
jgi:hypothetical protein